jgi:hypothetical protein
MLRLQGHEIHPAHLQHSQTGLLRAHRNVRPPGSDLSHAHGTLSTAHTHVTVLSAGHVDKQRACMSTIGLLLITIDANQTYIARDKSKHGDVDWTLEHKCA